MRNLLIFFPGFLKLWGIPSRHLCFNTEFMVIHDDDLGPVMARVTRGSSMSDIFNLYIHLTWVRCIWSFESIFNVNFVSSSLII